MKKEGLFLGAFLILIGSLWLLGNLKIISFSIYDLGSYIRKTLELWPLVLIVIGANMVTENKYIRGTILGICLIILILYLFFDFAIFNKVF